MRVELDAHPSEAKTWIAHTAYSTDVGQFTSVKKGSQGVVKVYIYALDFWLNQIFGLNSVAYEQEITKSHAALSAIFEYQIVRKGNAVINYECQDAKSLPEHLGDAVPLMATLFISCPESEGQEL